MKARLQRLLVLLFAVAGLVVLGACAGVPPRGLPAPSQALPPAGTANTTLGRLALASLPTPPAEPAAADTVPDNPSAASGFRLLPTGEFALDARLALIRQAERSVDLQAYHIHPDQSGRLLLRELRDAALRGVRIRLLVDDLYIPPVEDLLAGLASHPNVEVRLFNPLPLRHGPPLWRLLVSPGDFEQYNHRMHNKLLVADNQMAIYGGRNIGDEYFMGHRQANFIDMDVLSTGAVVPALSAVFDRYWNSEVVWPLPALHTRHTPAADTPFHHTRFNAEVRDAEPPARAAYETDPAGQTAVSQQLAQGRLVLVRAQAEVHADAPEKAADPGLLTRPTEAMQGLLDSLGRARRSVAIVSPYFVPGEIGLRMMRQATAAGVRTLLFTNSLGSTDEPLVYERYSRYRIAMLEAGVEIHEFSPELTRRLSHFGSFGQSTPRLHAKVAVVDRRSLTVGSVNLDARSAVGNTEMAVTIHSPELAEAMTGLLTQRQQASMYRLRLAPDRRSIEWTATDESGHTTVTRDEPGHDAWQRFKLWLQALFIDERLL